MQQRILEFVFDSFGLSADKVIPCIRILREQAIAVKRFFKKLSLMMEHIIVGVLCNESLITVLWKIEKITMIRRSAHVVREIRTNIVAFDSVYNSI